MFGIARFERAQVRQSPMLGLRSDDNISHLLLYFWIKLAENNNFGVKTVRTFLILTEKIDI
jgi:hypothetical protein